MQTLNIINDPPYGTERLYNGLRLAHALLKREGDICVFLLGDAVSGVNKSQEPLAGPGLKSRVGAMLDSAQVFRVQSLQCGAHRPCRANQKAQI